MPRRFPLLPIFMIVLTLMGFALLYHSQSHSTLAPKALGLAADAPVDAQLFVAFDGRTAGKNMTMGQAFDSLPAAQTAEWRKQMERYEKETGVPFDMIYHWAVPAAFGEAFPLPGQKSVLGSAKDRPCDVVLAVAAIDEKTARDTLSDYFKQHGELHARTENTANPSSWTVGPSGHEWEVRVDHKWVLLGTGAQAVDHAVQALEHKAPSLLSNPTFKAAMTQLSADEPGLAFAATRDIFGNASLESLDKDWIDDYTVKTLKGCEYAVGGARNLSNLTDPSQPAMHAFVKIDATNDTGLIKALSHPQHLDPSLARYFPAAWHNYTAGNLKYVYDNVMQAAQLPPKARLAMLFAPAAIPQTIGVSLDDLLGATTGAYGFALDGTDVDFSQLGNAYVMPLEMPKCGALLAVRLADRGKFEDCVHKIESKFHLHARVSGSVHSYGSGGSKTHACWAIDNDVLLLALGRNATRRLQAGLHPQHAIADEALYKTSLPSDTSHLVGCTFADLSSLAQLAGDDKPGAAHQPPALQPLIMALHLNPKAANMLWGFSTTRLDADGLHWDQRGAVPSTGWLPLGLCVVAGGIAVDAQQAQQVR
jgi:hypothetical protein